MATATNSSNTSGVSLDAESDELLVAVADALRRNEAVVDDICSQIRKADVDGRRLEERVRAAESRESRAPEVSAGS
jgi:hypothetical protein